MRIIHLCVVSPYPQTTPEQAAAEVAKTGKARTASKPPSQPPKPGEKTAMEKSKADLDIAANIAATSPKIPKRQQAIEKAAAAKGKGPESPGAKKAKTLEEFKEAAARHERKAKEAQRKGKKMKDVEGGIEATSPGGGKKSAKDQERIIAARLKKWERRGKRRERRRRKK